MLSRNYKSAFGEYIQPVNLVLHRLRVSPDHLTFAGIVFGGLAGLAFARGRLVLAGVFLILAGVSDMLDGSLARASGEASPFGSYIDSVADRFTEVLIFTGIAWHMRGKTELLVVLAALAGSFLVSYAKARAEALRRPLRRRAHGAARTDHRAGRRRPARPAAAGALGAGHPHAVHGRAARAARPHGDEITLAETETAPRA